MKRFRTGRFLPIASRFIFKMTRPMTSEERMERIDERRMRRNELRRRRARQRREARERARHRIESDESFRPPPALRRRLEQDEGEPLRQLRPRAQEEEELPDVAPVDSIDEFNLVHAYAPTRAGIEGRSMNSTHAWRLTFALGRVLKVQPRNLVPCCLCKMHSHQLFNYVLYITFETGYS